MCYTVVKSHGVPRKEDESEQIGGVYVGGQLRCAWAHGI